MLDFFRQKGLTSVVYGAIIVATVLVFVIGFNPTAGKKLGSVSEACAARVRGACIEPKAHRAAYRLVFSRGTMGMKQSMASRLVLEGLIERELLTGEANRLGLTVGDDEITDAIFHGLIHISLPSENLQLQQSMGIVDGRVSVPFFNDPKTKQFDLKAYERNVKQLTGRSPVEFREWQSREILAAKMRDLVRAPVRVADDEAFDRFVTERSTATVSYSVVRRAWIEKYGITATDKDIDAWAKDKTNLENVKVPVRHILLKFAGEKPSDADKDVVKSKARGILDRVKKGEDFSKLAKEFSDDPGSKDKGGMYPGEMVDQFVEPFRKAVLSVAPGELVQDVVETQFGYHIIKRDPASREDLGKAYRESKSLDLSKQMAHDIAAAVKGGKSGDEAIAEAITKYATVKPTPAKKDGASAKDAGANAAGDAGAATGDDGGGASAVTAENDPERPQWLQSSAFNRTGEPIPAISPDASAAVLKFAFTAKAGDVEETPIRTDDGFLVVALKEQKPAARADYDKERDGFIQALVEAKQGEALSQYVRRLREASKDEIKIDENNVFGAKSDAGPTDDDEP